MVITCEKSNGYKLENEFKKLQYFLHKQMNGSNFAM